MKAESCVNVERQADRVTNGHATPAQFEYNTHDSQIFSYSKIEHLFIFPLQQILSNRSLDYKYQTQSVQLCLYNYNLYIQVGKIS